ncbi:unnamed protein product [Darwinula stevensoni]|uniref:Sex-determining region Y protein n=1 Tax=Darwinula stevensoni TaxID=69355 RepID=A0A7R8X275_9CRUS|nr:unnamed protein product [Darwinula stevensoni]CAG0881121.1 unnamed protein product [Darwinula stevensoni]
MEPNMGLEPYFGGRAGDYHQDGIPLVTPVYDINTPDDPSCPSDFTELQPVQHYSMEGNAMTTVEVESRITDPDDRSYATVTLNFESLDCLDPDEQEQSSTLSEFDLNMFGSEGYGRPCPSSPSILTRTDLRFMEAYREEFLASLYQHSAIPRPPNAFMVFAKEWRPKLAQQFNQESNKDISVRLGQVWKALDAEEKRKYYALSHVAEEDHKQKYPGYVYNPREARLRKALRDLGLEPQGIISLLEARDSIWHLDENGEEEPLTPKARQRDVMDRLLASVGVQMSPSTARPRSRSHHSSGPLPMLIPPHDPQYSSQSFILPPPTSPLSCISSVMLTAAPGVDSTVTTTADTFCMDTTQPELINAPQLILYQYPTADSSPFEASSLQKQLSQGCHSFRLPKNELFQPVFTVKTVESIVKFHSEALDFWREFRTVIDDAEGKEGAEQEKKQNDVGMEKAGLKGEEKEEEKDGYIYLSVEGAFDFDESHINVSSILSRTHLSTIMGS